MLLFMIAFGFGLWVLNFVAIAQFLWLLFARQPNQLIALFGNALSAWLAEIGRFLTAADRGDAISVTTLAVRCTVAYLRHRIGQVNLPQLKHGLAAFEHAEEVLARPLALSGFVKTCAMREKPGRPTAAGNVETRLESTCVCCACAGPSRAGFSDIGMMHDATISDRCSRSAKARSRGRWSTGGAAGSMGIVPEFAASDD